MSNYYKSLHAYIDAIDETIKNVPEYLTEKLHKHADDLVRETRQRTPVDTGNLRDSWKRSGVLREGDTYKVSITNDARNPKYGTEYATYVEYGHNSTSGNWVPGRFMLTESQEEERVRLQEDLEKDQVSLYSRLI